MEYTLQFFYLIPYMKHAAVTAQIQGMPALSDIITRQKTQSKWAHPDVGIQKFLKEIGSGPKSRGQFA